MALPDKKRLRQIADRLWSCAVREDWFYTCAVCGRDNVEAHHLVPRQFEATRYALRNGIALCAQCHKFDPKISPHQNAAAWLEWLEDAHPELAKWYYENNRPDFCGTKTKTYYVEQIQSLREYVPDEEFARIVGVRLTAWLDQKED